MSRLDDRLTTELERAARPADPAGAFERIDRRRARHHAARRIRAGALAVVVIAGSIGGFAYLSDAFRGSTNVGGDRTPLPLVPSVNGVIAAAELTADGGLHLVTVNPDGTDRHVIKAKMSGDLWLPAWSPDGAKLAVATSSPGLGPLAIWVMNADGSEPIKVAEATNIYQPSWSPDGTQVAYAADLPDGAAIHIVDADGEGDHVIGEVLRHEHYYSASFSPDGTQILYDAATGSASNIFLMAVDGTRTRQLTSTGTDYSPTWSPDGSQIAFARTERGGGSDIYVMNADGSSVRRLTDGGVDVTNRNPTWSPDGKLIAYHASFVIDGPGALVIMNADGAHPVTILDEGVMGIAWQPLPATATPAPAVADLGLGFPVCNVQSMSADFDGNGKFDTTAVVTKMSDVDACPAPGTSTEVLVVDLNGDGKADAVGGPLACPGGCEPFAAPDVDGDGLPEIAIVVDRPGDGTKRIQLWDVTTPPGGSLAVLPFLDENGDPATFTWGTDGTNEYGVSCTSRTSPPLVTEWQAIPTGPDSWHISEHGYHVVRTELRSAFEDSYDVPGEETVFPDGGGDTMCGAPVHVSG
jgi:dipeptidyl aminopeptidase/acylaminoacyl peptidase